MEPRDGRRDVSEESTTTAGVVSDTHGLLRPEVLRLFLGVDLILHAGDVGDPRILTDLAAVAPLRAVWGNVDGWDVRRETEEEVRLEVGGVSVAVAHGHRVPEHDRLLDRHPDARVVIHGHTHRPKVDRRADERLLLNPGSAGPKRFGKPVTAALLRLRPGGEPEVEIRDLETGAAREPDRGEAGPE